ncbi:helix-turn-helix transcriptional regulator [Lapidilactobacillus wuchangensis]|uniref:helix-turn-helix transcriptional regulator n=1 Tax=Lapidilactobacillus wuchangensis TaxID=2486001 RepID=UPI000F775301|nr:WYL domain-containing protein [Lapidilactobacillus wuchangensis]
MNSNYRVAETLVRLMLGEVVDYESLQQKYDISHRTFQRDLHDIEGALAEVDPNDSYLKKVENRQQYYLVREDLNESLNKVLLISNILLASRALTNAEMKECLTYLQAGLPPNEREQVANYLVMPKSSYLPLTNAQPLLVHLRQLSDCILNHQVLTFDYQGSWIDDPEPHEHEAQPVALFFEKYYFYVAMYNVQTHGYWFNRVDRILKIKKITAGKPMDYGHDFSLIDRRQQSYFFHTGQLITFRFECLNCYPPTALDHFPGSKIVGHNAAGQVIIEARFKFDAALFWIMSQGAKVKVISPPSLITRLQYEMKATLDLY